MTIECRPSSAVHRRTHSPQAPSRAEHPLDRAEVVREVVLGQQVDEQRAADRVGQRDVARRTRPRLAGLEVAAPAPRDDLVGEPLLGARQVAVEQPATDGLELGDAGDGEREGIEENRATIDEMLRAGERPDRSPAGPSFAFAVAAIVSRRRWRRR